MSGEVETATSFAVTSDKKYPQNDRELYIYTPSILIF